MIFPYCRRFVSDIHSPWSGVCVCVPVDLFVCMHFRKNRERRTSSVSMHVHMYVDSLRARYIGDRLTFRTVNYSTQKTDEKPIFSTGDYQISIERSVVMELVAV